IYKSKGLADRLGIVEIPAVVYIKNKKIESSLMYDITLERIESLL
ncbi:MAG: pyridine nucleotide-disulfide oxidoreductase, partial [Peptostreptococcaceae bacterium]|nr:pyridine nucleotide-disulfide oxidoreductase [Peptostreptococcaceae bacterium]